MKTPFFSPIIEAGYQHEKRPFMADSGGRALVQYHALCYVIRGEGFFQDFQTPRTLVTAGTCIWCFPDKWQYFDPSTGTTWDEWWVKFDGGWIEQTWGDLLPSGDSIFNVGIITDIIRMYERIVDIRWRRISGSVSVPPQEECFLLHKLLYNFWKLRKPLDPESTFDTSPIVAGTQRYIGNTLKESHFDGKACARYLGISYEQMRKEFRKVTGTAPCRYYDSIRVRYAKELLTRHSMAIKDAQYALGFSDASYFTHWFKKCSGMSPSEYRKKYSQSAM
jgi:AraC-like DNA-binding protein